MPSNNTDLERNLWDAAAHELEGRIAENISLLLGSL
jgi:hypothetical protein